MTALRPYQARGISAVRDHVVAGRRHVLLCGPTGSGKTLTAAEIMRSAVALGSRVLFVVHLRELVNQTVKALASLGHNHIGVMRGDDARVDEFAPVQVASIQTLARRQKPRANIIILDEAHRSIADTYEKHIWQAYPDEVVIGLTATPCRGDGRPLGERYDALVVAATYAELIDAGHISRPTVFAAKREADLSGVRKVAGDFVESDLEQAMGQLVGDIVGEWQLRAEGLRTIVFASGIKHSKQIVEEFRTFGYAAEHLDGETPDAERKAILERLASGETTIVSNCAVLTEGFDCPAVRCAILARPTLSLVLHRQTVGRVLRAGEIPPVVLDHAGNCARHGLPTDDLEWSLSGNAKPKKKVEHRVCKQCYAYFPARDTVCPHCGWVAPVVERKLPEVIPGQLEEATTQKLQRDFYLAQVSLARARGFKPGFATFKYKEKYGNWAPYHWHQETMNVFHGDADWQDALTKRTREREFWKEQDAKAKAIVEERIERDRIELLDGPALAEPEVEEKEWFE